MFQLKLQFLEDQNFALRKQVSSLQKLITIESESQQKSVLYQLSRTNDELASELQATKDKLFLEREARQIQQAQHEEIVSELNRNIFELNHQLSILEDIMRKEKRLEYEPNCIELWFKEKLNLSRNQIYQKYADPVLFFEILQGILEALQEKHSEFFSLELEDSTERLPEQKQEHINSFLKETESPIFGQDPLAEIGESSSLKLNTESKWGKERSSLHFLKGKKMIDLHLNLSAAKIVQLNYVKAQQRAQGKKFILNTNVDLLRKSYVVLIGEYENLKKKNRLLSRYIEELQHRNKVLLKNRVQTINI